MNRFWKLLGTVVIVIFIAGALLQTMRIAQNEADTISNSSVGTNLGNLAPDFTGTTLSGETLKLSEMRGKTVLINAFASWCAPCILETPDLVDAYNASDGDFIFIGLNVLESKQAVAGYQEEFNVSYPLVLNPDGKLTEIFKPVGLPTSWFIDPQGVVRYIHAGAMTPDLIQEALQSVSAGRTPGLKNLDAVSSAVKKPDGYAAGAANPQTAPTNKRIVDENEYNYPQLLPYDMIRPVYNPHFVNVAESPLVDNELVMGVALDGEAKAYPVSVLSFREMVNDELGGWPILITW
jgi:thiol-disulfide isomerase/thioredoxin